jgi:hypothetical protein
MGTRADFYVGKGEKAEWLGSIAWDGYPEGINKGVLNARTERGFRQALKNFFSERDDVSKPETGWPWPWEDSQTTDYAYAFDAGKVWVSGFGRPYLTVKQRDKVGASEELYKEYSKRPKQVFPNMKEKQKTTFGPRSGLMVIGPNGPVEDLP